jgi:hypothetical protein
MNKEKKIYCERCKEVLKPDRIVWLEYSQTDQKYYRVLPEEHLSQGCFPFGSGCAKIETQNSN